MEHGFFHPSRGYWQTNSEPPQHILDGYPEGTVEVPLKPGANYEWDGLKWVQLPPPAPTEDEILSQRDALLKESDWTQLPDTPVDQSTWVTYRQELRDIPQQEGFPESVIWPTKPEQ
ncbi:MAG: hypothetical protein EYR95_19010 [Phormidium sp. SL48-SHIP]|nr:MAG: hypothetical protein EYR95_19010 [Phormidium sp. SL48-SHIP]